MAHGELTVTDRLGVSGGLGNRLDAIATILMVTASGPEPEILWPLNDHLPVHFSDLFTRLPRGRIVEAPIDGLVSAKFAALLRSLPPLFRDDEAYRKIFREILQCAVPEVTDEVEVFGAQYPSPPLLVGVHVRRLEQAGRVISPFAQPFRYYEAMMHSFPPDTRFLICTDSPFAYPWFSKRFGRRAIQRAKVAHNRSEVAGVREGLIDMILLSRCRCIVGTSGSSFTQLAEAAADVKVCYMRAIPRVHSGWPHFSPVRWIWAYRHFVCEPTFWKRWWLYDSPGPRMLWWRRQLVRRGRSWISGKSVKSAS